MKTSVTVTFTLLFIAVGLSYLYLNPSRSEPLELAATRMELLPAEEGDIRLIQIQNLDQNKIITLERTPEAWMIRYPVHSLADRRVVDGLVAALKYSKKARRLPLQKNWEEFGLSRPSLKVGIETRRGEKRKYLYLGDASPVGTFVFARWEGEKEYFLIHGELKNVFKVSLYSLRMKRLLTLPLADISKISSRTFSQAFEWEKREGTWFWMEPISILGTKISEEEMHKILSLAGGLHVKEFLDGEEADAAKVFPVLPASVRIFSKDGTEQGLILGQEIPDRDAYYAKQESGVDSVFLVSRERIQEFFSLIQEASEKAPSGEIKADNGRSEPESQPA